MHEALEAKSAALAAERATPAHLCSIRDRLDDLRRAAETGDRRGMSEADGRFHAAIHDASANDIIARFLGELAELSRVTRLMVMELPSRPQRVVAEHQAIADAIERRDPTGAAQAVVAHVQRSKDEIRAVARQKAAADRF
jgi:GntR family transcriptional repressor for pyruvate dehydrogenase complex